MEVPVCPAVWVLDVVEAVVEVEVQGAKAAHKQPAPMATVYAPVAGIKLNTKLGSPAMSRSALNAKRK